MCNYYPVHNIVPCLVSMSGHCHVLPWLIQFCGVVLSCFTLSHETIVMEVLPMQREDLPVPLFKAIVYSRSWVRKLVNNNETEC